MLEETFLIQGRYQGNTACQDILRQYWCGNQLYKPCKQYKQDNNCTLIPLYKGTRCKQRCADQEC